MISEIELHHYLGNGKSKYNVIHWSNTTGATSRALFVILQYTVINTPLISSASSFLELDMFLCLV